MSDKRTLYQCLNAKVQGEHICCSKGYSFPAIGGCLKLLRLQRGDVLALGVCQKCPDYDEMGPPIPKEERGWAKKMA